MAPDVTPAMRLPERTTSVDARLLPDIIALYMQHKASNGAITNKTEENYRTQLAPWHAFWRDCAHIHNHHLSPDILSAALEWMRTEYRTRLGTPPAANSVEHCWSRLKSVLLWAFTNNCTGTVDVSAWCPHVEHIEPAVHFPDLGEMTVLFAQPAGETRLRDIAIMAYMLSTGARRFEVAEARAELTTFATPPTDINVGDDHSGWTHLQKVKGDSAGNGAGRVVCFDTTCGLILKCYLRSVARTTGPLFGMTDTGLGQMIDRHAQAAHVGEVSPHGFRRMLSDYWDERHGMAGRHALKKQLGHNLEKGDVTERHYISRNPKRVAREIAKWHVSPLMEMTFDWGLFPVHVPNEAHLSPAAPKVR